MGTCYTIHAEIMLGKDWHCLAIFELGKAYGLTSSFEPWQEPGTTPVRHASAEALQAIEDSNSCYVLTGRLEIATAIQHALIELRRDNCGDVPRAHQYKMLFDWATASASKASRLVLTGL